MSSTISVNRSTSRKARSSIEAASHLEAQERRYTRLCSAGIQSHSGATTAILPDQTDACTCESNQQEARKEGGRARHCTTYGGTPCPADTSTPSNSIYTTKTKSDCVAQPIASFHRMRLKFEFPTSSSVDTEDTPIHGDSPHAIAISSFFRARFHHVRGVASQSCRARKGYGGCQLFCNAPWTDFRIFPQVPRKRLLLSSKA